MMPKPAAAPKPLEGVQTATTVTRRWTVSIGPGTGFVVEATRGQAMRVTLATHPAARAQCPKCEKDVAVPAMVLDAAALDTLIRLLTGVRDVKLPELEQFGMEEN